MDVLLRGAKVNIFVVRWCKKVVFFVEKRFYFFYHIQL